MTALPPSRALYTAAQVRALDARAGEAFALDGATLMSRAAAGAFAVLRRSWPLARRLAVLAGPGNNGGDAYLVACEAHAAGLDVDVVALGDAATADARAAREAWRARGPILSPTDAGDRLASADVVVDGLFGSGLRRPLEGTAAALVASINASRKPVLALDVPSGLDADTGSVRGIAVRATRTVVFIGWKRGLFTADGPDHAGACELDTLGVRAALFESVGPDAERLDGEVRDVLAPRAANTNKGRHGHVLAIGGDDGMAGAVRLAAEAALRVGAGLVSVATRGAHVTALNAARPELMARGVDGPQAIAPLVERASVLAVGPGLGTSAWSHALWDVAVRSGKPLVLDADGLNLLARDQIGLPAVCVLTPHPGEAARLLGVSVAEVQADRFAAVRELARRHRAVVVLKGAGSLVADPADRVALCPFGNPGMASGGMGDVLTGVVAGLLAQGLEAWQAACAGVVVHARAGDLAAGTAPRGLVAGDLFEPLRRLVNPEST